MKRILFVGDSLSQTTGMSYVSVSVMRRFQRHRYELGYVTLSGADSTPDGLKAHGEAVYQEFCKIPMYNAQTQFKDRIGEFDRAVSEFKPNVVFAIQDPWVVDIAAYSRLRSSYYLVGYPTIETPQYPEHVLNTVNVIPLSRKSIAETLNRFDLIIPVTKMGKSAMERIGVTCGEPVLEGLDLEECVTETQDRTQLFGTSLPENAFIFMSMGMNTERKRLDKVIEAFAKFISKRNDAERYRLYVHTDLNAHTGGTDLKTMITSLGIADSVLIPHGYRAGQGIDRHELYRRYRACDCYIGLPSGEGFGYGFAEAMAHGKPLIYINYGGHVEYCSRAGLGVSVGSYTYARGAYIKWALADTDDAARVMARMVSDKNMRGGFEKAALQIASEKLDWDRNCEQIIEQVCEGYGKIKDTSLMGVPLRRIL